MPETPPIPRLAGVCGWPVHHSLSPALHGYWLRRMGVRGAYVPFLVRPDRALDAFRSLTRTSITGVNVTMPLKAIAFQAADERSAEARALGVANVLYKRGGRLIAHNTDMEGFSAPLVARMGEARLRRTTALVVGAGGASRAVLGALVRLGVPEIRVTARRDPAARALADSLSLPSLYAVDWSARTAALRGAGLVINATSAGMRGHAPLDLPMGSAEPGALAYDLVYTPRDTPFLLAARARGLDTLDGLAMLIAQARPAFATFFGERPPDDLDPAPVLDGLL